MVPLPRLLALLLGVVVASLAIEVVSAADLSPATAHLEAAWRLFDEARLGVFAHDPSSPESGSADINAELLSGRLPLIAATSPWLWLAPRLHLGTSLNTGGKTSTLYGGLTWTVNIFSGAFVEASFGGAVHDGDTGRDVSPGRNALGCSPLFRESASAGYRLDEHWSVMATIEHMSNAGLCVQNRGLTNYGVRLGYVF